MTLAGCLRKILTVKVLQSQTAAETLVLRERQSNMRVEIFGLPE